MTSTTNFFDTKGFQGQRDLTWPVFFLFPCTSISFYRYKNNRRRPSSKCAQPEEESALSTNDILLELSSGRQLMVLLLEQNVDNGCLNGSAVPLCKKRCIRLSIFWCLITNLIIILTIRKLSNDLPLYMNYYHLLVNFD